MHEAPTSAVRSPQFNKDVQSVMPFQTQILEDGNQSHRKSKLTHEQLSGLNVVSQNYGRKHSVESRVVYSSGPSVSQFLKQQEKYQKLKSQNNVERKRLKESGSSFLKLYP